MIHQMLMNDVLRFCLIYLVFLMGFAQAFFVLFESVGVSGFIVSIKTCFVAMLGDFELDQFADTPYTAVSVGLLVVYVVTITILLLNLLIAMMGDTYEKVSVVRARMVGRELTGVVCHVQMAHLLGCVMVCACVCMCRSTRVLKCNGT